mmetsp:Transcript_22678/g.61419  ORF Transcript_22678/g.61419 Transcript_22678/m.61419 type:complete len:221 (+) Transcript_22678:2246-2908(+)
MSATASKKACATTARPRLPPGMVASKPSQRPAAVCVVSVSAASAVPAAAATGSPPGTLRSRGDRCSAPKTSAVLATARASAPSEGRPAATSPSATPGRRTPLNAVSSTSPMMRPSKAAVAAAGSTCRSPPRSLVANSLVDQLARTTASSRDARTVLESASSGKAERAPVSQTAGLSRCAAPIAAPPPRATAGTPIRAWLAARRARRGAFTPLRSLRCSDS